jgi:uncharacterized protein (DUF1501 family)
MRWSRRTLLRSLAAATLLPALPARAAPLPGRKFVFVFVRGGWDTTRVFSPLFHEPDIDMEPEATLAEAHGLPFVDHPERPSVHTFFQVHGQDVAVLDGLLVRSVNHAVCERLVLTGSSRPDAPDWPTILGSTWGDQLAVPSLVVNGPTMPGRLHRYTSIAGGGGQLSDLLLGDAVDRRLPVDVEDRLDAFLTERLASPPSDHPAVQRMWDASSDGLARALRLRDETATIPLQLTSVTSAMETSTDLLAQGVCRCVSFSDAGWDTHSANEAQSGSFSRLFNLLGTLINRLRRADGADGGTLYDETTIVVLSEMGRTPYLNDKRGKDHWPYTAAMLIGAGIRGGQRVGGYDRFLNGSTVDLTSGERHASGVVLSPSHLGATLLALGDVDPTPWVAEPPIAAVMA